MARLEILTPETMTPEQKAACEAVMSGPRGKVPLPMQAWLRNPELADRIQKLGEVLRYTTTLGPRLTELAILVGARHWTAHFEWKAHKAYALRDGLDPRVIADIAARRAPFFGDDAAGLAVYEVTAALHTTGRIPEALYRRAVSQFGERGVVELVTLAGYYCLAAFTLNAFELGLPDNAVPELEDPEYPQANPAT